MNTPDPTRDDTGAQTAPSAQSLLEVAIAAAGAAADHLRSLNRQHLAREYKANNHDIVTEHDRACEDLVAATIAERCPGARILGEEAGERPSVGTSEVEQGSGPNARVTFYVDPIDGTSNFAAGLPLFCVSVAAAVDEVVVAGVIDAPILDQVFTAADGPAYLNGVEIEPRSTRAPEDALVLTGYPGYLSFREQPEIAAHAAGALHEGVSAVRHFGTAALELAYVAAGWADATLLAQINAWDIAAGFHIVRKAGGSIRTWPGYAPTDIPEQYKPAYVACSGPERLEVLDSLMDEVQQGRDQVREA